MTALQLIATDKLTDAGEIRLDVDTVAALHLLIFDQGDALETLKKRYYEAWAEAHPQDKAA